MILFGTHATNYMHVDIDWPRNKTTLNSCYNVQFSISWQYLTSKLQKVPRIPNIKRKVDISSNFNGLFQVGTIYRRYIHGKYWDVK